MNAFMGKIRIEANQLPIWSIDLFRFTVNDSVEQRHAVRLCPQPHLSSVAEGRIFDLEQLFAVVEHLEAVALKVDAQAKPPVGWDRNVNCARCCVRIPP